jgi:hypothetical protein
MRNFVLSNEFAEFYRSKMMVWLADSHRGYRGQSDARHGLSCAFIHTNCPGTCQHHQIGAVRDAAPEVSGTLQSPDDLLGDEQEERTPRLTVHRIDCSHAMPALLPIELADGKGIIIYRFGGKHEEYGADSY